MPYAGKSDHEAAAMLARYARWLYAHHGVPPTVREWCEWAGFSSTSNGAYWLNRFQIEGWLMHAVPERRASGTVRTNDLVLTEEGRMAILSRGIELSMAQP